ncbi:hypothetical protein [Paenibacillus sp. LHD-38]|uniref:hypothetical protein n=1 Tax=Paenibacillus sp. LHD-38 TaxID=3072143 RepID=UPI00280D1602|nr:hypothetical protein [Paenibacillus sp. LHD-38]MDQ8734224.1 hypothetical protein [Paenibacillus sp. LHD-38]
MKLGILPYGLIILVLFISGCTINGVTNSDNISTSLGTIVYKDVMNEKFRFLLIPKTEGFAYEKMSLKELESLARSQNDSSWYTLSEEIYNKINIGQNVEVKWDSSHQFESNPPIRFMKDINVIPN